MSTRHTYNRSARATSKTPVSMLFLFLTVLLALPPVPPQPSVAQQTPDDECIYDNPYVISETERAAITAIYDHWEIERDETASPCTWPGTLCYDSQCEIEPPLYAMSYIQTLNGNNLSGSIPPELGNLANLEYIFLSGNNLSGSIPPELGNLANLTTLSLFGNNLSGSIPPELGNLANLDRLFLDGNNLSGSIPPELGNLANLRYLSLLENNLSGSIPPELGNLANLDGLELGRSNLSGSIPPELGNLANLRYLDLFESNLSGSIPPELGNLANLKWLLLGRNNLSGSIPPELGNLANLEWLGLFENNLSGSIPPELGNLANLEDLSLDENYLSGSIPPELGNLANLEDLSLDENYLSGSIPPELGNLANLKWLGLRENYLSGSIPTELTNLSNLLKLTLDQNCGILPSFSDSKLIAFLNKCVPDWASWKKRRPKSACSNLPPTPTPLPPSPTPIPIPTGDPEIIEVSPKYPLGENIRYLLGVPASNEIEVEVNWGADGPGYVTFQLNEQTIDVPATTNTVVHTYDMGSDLQAELNTLTITAYDAEGQATSPVEYKVSAIPQPVWLQGMQQIGLIDTPVLEEDDASSFAGSFHTGMEFPVPPLNIKAEKLGPINKAIDLKIKAQREIVIPLTCSANAEVKTMVEAGGFKFLDAEIALQFYESIKEPSDPETCIIGDITGQSGVKAEFKKTLYKKPLLLMIAYLNPVVGRTVDTIISNLGIEEAADILGEFYLDGKGNVDLNFNVTFVDDPSVQYIRKEDAKLAGMIGLQGGYRNELSLASIDAYMGANTTLTTKINGFFTTEDDWSFESIKAVGEAGLKIRVLWHIREVKGQVSWSYPDESTPQGLLAQSDEIEDSGWQWIEATSPVDALAIEPSVAQVFASTPHSSLADGVTQVTTGTHVSNVYQYPETTMAIYTPTNTALMLWVQPDTDMPAGQSHEIFYSLQQGDEWSTPTRVTSDTLLDDAPEIAWIDENNAVAIWHRLSEPVQDEDEDDEEIWNNAWGKQMEIATATYDVASDTWSPTTLVMTNTALDALPTISRGHDGDIWAAWRQNADGKLLGDTDSPDNIMVASYQDGWSIPDVALADIPGVFDLDIASGNDAATIVFTRMMSEEDELTAHVFRSTWDGSDWSSARQITSDVEGKRPQVIYNAQNQPLVTWLTDNSLELRNLATATIATFWLPAAIKDIAEYHLVLNADGSLAIVFVTANQPQNVYGIYYDQQNNRFSMHQQLTDNQNSKAYLTPGFTPDGRLLVGYTETEIEMTSQTTTDPDTGETVEYAMPTEGATDMMILSTTRPDDLPAAPLPVYLPLVVADE